MDSRMVVAGFALLMLAGCGESKLDGSSEAALKESVDKVAKGLSAEKQAQFKQDLGLISVSQMDVAGVLAGKKSAEGLFDETRKGLDGKTADQVMAQAAQIRIERELKERTQALAEIQELLAKQAASVSAVAELKKFSVSKSRFAMRDQKYTSQKEPLIYISVINGTSHPISRAYFKGTIASSGRSIPWFSGDFNYGISGGLEPGENADWVLAPNAYGDWGKVDAPADAVFTVEVTRLDGPDNKALFDAAGFSEANNKRLQLLQQKYSGS